MPQKLTPQTVRLMNELADFMISTLNRTGTLRREELERFAKGHNRSYKTISKYAISMAYFSMPGPRGYDIRQYPRYYHGLIRASWREAEPLSGEKRKQLGKRVGRRVAFGEGGNIDLRKFRKASRIFLTHTPVQDIQRVMQAHYTDDYIREKMERIVRVQQKIVDDVQAPWEAHITRKYLGSWRDMGNKIHNELNHIDTWYTEQKDGVEKEYNNSRSRISLRLGLRELSGEDAQREREEVERARKEALAEIEERRALDTRRVWEIGEYEAMARRSYETARINYLQVLQNNLRRKDVRKIPYPLATTPEGAPIPDLSTRKGKTMPISAAEAMAFRRTREAPHYVPLDAESLASRLEQDLANVSARYRPGAKLRRNFPKTTKRWIYELADRYHKHPDEYKDIEHDAFLKTLVRSAGNLKAGDEHWSKAQRLRESLMSKYPGLGPYAKRRGRGR